MASLISSSFTCYIPHFFLVCFLLSCSLEFPAFYFVVALDLSVEAGILKAECLKAPKATESVALEIYGSLGIQSADLINSNGRKVHTNGKKRIHRRI